MKTLCGVAGDTQRAGSGADGGTMPLLYLKTNASLVISEPELCLLAGAYFGEIMKMGFGGQWRIWKGAGFRDAVVRIGKGRNRHDISPGLMAFRVTMEPVVSLEGILCHEVREMACG